MIRLVVHMMLVAAFATTAGPAGWSGPRLRPSALEQHDTESRARATLARLEQAILSRDIDVISRHFAPRVYINLFTGENGYFSSEQSYFILKGFLSAHSPISLSIQPSGTKRGTPYGVGPLLYVHRGRRGSAQVFIALIEDDRGYRLSQFTVVSR